jgi:hypothetical protein
MEATAAPEVATPDRLQWQSPESNWGHHDFQSVVTGRVEAPETA